MYYYYYYYYYYSQCVAVVHHTRVSEGVKERDREGATDLTKHGTASALGYTLVVSTLPRNMDHYVVYECLA